jgi:hypothetical protein
MQTLNCFLGVEYMEQVGVVVRGNPVNFKEKFISFFKGKDGERKAKEKEFISFKDKFEGRNEYLNKKLNFEHALINAGPIIFVGSPLNSSALEEILYEFVVGNSNNFKEVRLSPDNKIKNWNKFFEDIENPKINNFFIVEEDGKLKLGEEGINYISNVISKYSKEDNAA